MCTLHWIVLACSTVGFAARSFAQEGVDLDASVATESSRDHLELWVGENHCSPRSFPWNEFRAFLGLELASQSELVPFTQIVSHPSNRNTDQAGHLYQIEMRIRSSVCNRSDSPNLRLLLMGTGVDGSQILLEERLVVLAHPEEFVRTREAWMVLSQMIAENLRDLQSTQFLRLRTPPTHAPSMDRELPPRPRMQDEVRPSPGFRAQLFFDNTWMQQPFWGARLRVGRVFEDNRVWALSVDTGFFGHRRDVGTEGIDLLVWSTFVNVQARWDIAFFDLGFTFGFGISYSSVVGRSNNPETRDEKNWSLSPENVCTLDLGLPLGRNARLFAFGGLGLVWNGFVVRVGGASASYQYLMPRFGVGLEISF